MPKFFVDKTTIRDGLCVLTGENAHHIGYSLRMAVGEDLVLCDGEGLDYNAVITAMTSDSVTCRIDEILQSKAEPSVRLTLFQALPKGEKFDFIIQKAVECGASEIIPFESANCIYKMKDKEDSKTLRRQKIATEAAMQSRRSVIPHVALPISFKETLEALKNYDLALLCYEASDDNTIFSALKKHAVCDGQSVAIIIGSEGGFTPNEVSQFKNVGCEVVTLGKRILRTETAGIVALSVVNAYLDA